MAAALELARAGFGGVDGWLARPLVELEDWLKAAAQVLARQARASKPTRR